jgi:hypothetical protein
MLQGLNINGIDDCGLAQTTLSLAILLGQDVTLKCSRSYKLSRSRSFKAFRRCSVGLHFGHFILHNYQARVSDFMSEPRPALPSRLLARRWTNPRGATCAIQISTGLQRLGI